MKTTNVIQRHQLFEGLTYSDLLSLLEVECFLEMSVGKLLLDLKFMGENNSITCYHSWQIGGLKV